MWDGVVNLFAGVQGLDVPLNLATHEESGVVMLFTHDAFAVIYG
jgi:hypothetical protein